MSDEMRRVMASVGLISIMIYPVITQKGFRERIRRLKFLPCVLELIQNSRCKPNVLSDPHDKQAKLYRFLGLSKEGKLFYVQIKEGLKTEQRFLMSIFPVD